MLRITVLAAILATTVISIKLLMGNSESQPLAAQSDTGSIMTSTEAPSTGSRVLATDGTERGNTEITPELISHSKRAFRQLGELRSHLSHDVVARANLEELLSFPSSRLLAQKILTDLHFTKSEYGEDQALARIYSIKLLTLEMQNGNSAPIVDTIKAKTTQLTTLPAASRGEKQDLQDLLFSLFKSQAIPASEDFGNMLADFGYESSLRRVFRNAILLAWASDPEEPDEVRHLLKLTTD